MAEWERELLAGDAEKAAEAPAADAAAPGAPAEATQTAEAPAAPVADVPDADAAAAADAAPAADADAAVVTDGGFGPGSAVPLEDGSAPQGFSIKGNKDSMKYHTTDSQWYDQTVAEVWFTTAEAAEAAGFKAPGA